MSAKRPYRRAAYVWIGLLALLMATLGSAYIRLGPWNSVINLAIAAAKALLVAIFFMHLRTGSVTLRIVVLGALFTLALLVGLSLSDYLTRVRFPAPWQIPGP